MAKRKLGQHFLFDKNILRKLVNEMELTKRDNVLEIGAGRGTLTDILITSCKKVFAVEIDRWLVDFLKEKYKNFKNVEIIDIDILKLEIEELPVSIAMGNIPYYITTPIIFKLIEAENIKKFGLLMQKEVAERIVSKKGSKSYGILSISAQLYTTPEIRFIVKKQCFSPPPVVDSAFVVFEKKDVDKKLVERTLELVNIAFSMRRKTLYNNLKRAYGDFTDKFFDEIKMDKKIRAEEISVEEYLRMGELLTKNL
ncbi:MAG: 16S rRNA (adenine(1518)-N(6)/adenine(1519)-N(6))-dimethyltransferase RsmA [Proteobacteria bacterium]|nr:16S rRNA (adenine(1518)-N(6)/adenine(1519)-N(6))-dimethyltransferase RsmA [Pseudomonadota bacterium]